MPLNQAQLDDLLEHLIALTAVPEQRCERLVRLVLLLAERLDDDDALRRAIDDAMAAENDTLTLAIA